MTVVLVSVYLCVEVYHVVHLKDVQFIYVDNAR